MPDPVNKPQSPIPALLGVPTDPLIPATAPTATDIARGAAAMIDSPIADIFHGIKLPKSPKEILPLIPTLGSEIKSEDIGLFQGGKLGWSYSPATNTGMVTADFQNVIEGKHVTLTSNLQAWNNFDATGNHAAGGFFLKGNGPLEAKAGVIFAVGQENQIAVNATLQEWFKASYSTKSGLTLAAENNFSFLNVNGLKMNIYLSFGEGKGKVRGGFAGGFVR